ncbi:glucan endo-1,3-beta-glucosidase 3-like isoform X1 [Primulina huaijiensis]|uniref:glucan endo-1,3-beta-glucosidase 3-like isoform X1 n=1 Tax=Primulina huaijiensis TaxID=1492673 RepID=UPI003CC73278
MAWFLSIFTLVLYLAATSQESVEFLALHDSTPQNLEASSANGVPMAVQMDNEHLKNVSESVLMAESWVRANVLAHYPAINVSTIVIGNTILCNKDQEDKLILISPSIKNIHYSLTRWGLQNEIKVSASLSSNCLESNFENYRVDLAQNYIKPLLELLQEIGSPYVVNPPPHLVDLSDETLTILKSHSKSIQSLRVLHFKNTRIILSSPRKERPFTRKLSFMDLYSRIVPFPPRPTPISPFRSPLPPLVGTVSPPPNFLPFGPSQPPLANPTPHPFLPHLAPMANPTSPPFGLPHLPPCNPSGSVGAPVAGVHHGLWCVAKPNVPAGTLQEALDYACGEGGADCEAIKPQGACFFPDTVVAHASYAFNNYWQKTKRHGGTCSFGGTAMLIKTDPSKNIFCFLIYEFYGMPDIFYILET